MTKQSITYIRDLITPTITSYDVRKAGLFGSCARGDDDANSDIDMLVEFQGDKSLLDLIDLQTALESLLHKRVDLLTYQSLNPYIKDRVLSEHILIYEK